LVVSGEQVRVLPFLADGCEAGYVWSPHFVSIGSKQYRVPIKDGWYEHGQNCLEYLEINFGLKARKAREVPHFRNLTLTVSRAQLSHGAWGARTRRLCHIETTGG
jgi:hypothetical protein